MIEFTRYLSYDKETGVFVNKISRGRAGAGTAAGSKNKDGYLRVKVEGREFYLHRLAWFMTHNEWPVQIDHINGDKSDNRICNLRPADNSKNSCNKGVQSNNKSGYKGVSFHKASGLWRAACQVNGVKYDIGYFKSKRDAAIAIENKRIEVHGDFYRPLDKPADN